MAEESRCTREYKEALAEVRDEEWVTDALSYFGAGRDCAKDLLRVMQEQCMKLDAALEQEAAYIVQDGNKRCIQIRLLRHEERLKTATLWLRAARTVCNYSDISIGFKLKVTRIMDGITGLTKELQDDVMSV